MALALALANPEQALARALARALVVASGIGTLGIGSGIDIGSRHWHQALSWYQAIALAQGVGHERTVCKVLWKL